MRQAKKTIVVADHSKFGNANFIKVCDFEQIDMIVVDRSPPAKIMAEFEEAGVVVINAQEKGEKKGC
jgi:DeoR/GlpR family transcriptional regulator of sugar metabolism